MDKETRNKLRNAVVQCRKLLEDGVLNQLEGTFGIHRNGRVEDEGDLPHLDEDGLEARRRAVAAVEHIQGYGIKPADAVDQFQREVAFTHLNRLCAFKMLERRELVEETVSRGTNSNGFKVYLAGHPDDERLWRRGDEHTTYKHFLFDVCARLSDEIKMLFDTEHVSSYLFPSRRALEAVLQLVNAEELADIWDEDETIGWIYQYFTPKELREKARKESAAPRNSYELAFRNQFYTPRYVVQFLTDNTLGRTWYEMRKGKTRLVDQCEYMVRRPTDVFLGPGEEPPEEPDHDGDLSQEELLRQPVHVRHREKKAPWEIKILDPASGSGHFLLHAFDLLETIYDEAYDDPDIGPRVQALHPNRERYVADVPAMILRHNLHGIDIDLRSTQIAALALWMRAQRSYQRLGLSERPKIKKTNIVCAEPMPGNEALLEEFCDSLQPSLLGDLVRDVWGKMKLAGEAGSLLKIEEEIRDVVRQAQEAWREAPRGYKISLFDGTVQRPVEQVEFDFSDVTSPEFWQKAEALLLDALALFASRAANGREYGRRLFADDAEQGFAFIELCRESYDVVLMNPPFGYAPPTARGYCDVQYPDSRADLGMAFVDRGLSVGTEVGLVGAITTRVFIANDSLEKWRVAHLIDGGRLRCLADLGYGVLDEAMVEAAIYTLGGEASTNRSFCLRLLDERDKEAALCRELSSAMSSGSALAFWRSPTVFGSIPGRVLCYWLPESLLAEMSRAKNLIAEEACARHGLQTTDDFRFLRLAWEVSPGATGPGRRWVYFAKGGEYQPYWDDLHLVINWQDDGAELKEFVAAKSEQTQGGGGWSRWINAWEDYFKPGLTFPERTTSDFSPRVLPADCIFSATGEAIFFTDLGRAASYLVGAYTRHFKLVLDAFVGSGDSSVSGSAAKHYRSGLINAIPPPCSDLRSVSLPEVMQGISAARTPFLLDETSRLFQSPYLSSPGTSSLALIASQASRSLIDGATFLLDLSMRAESDVCAYLEMGESGAPVVDAVIGRHPNQYPDEDVDASDEGLRRLWTTPEAELVAAAVAKHGARRQLTKKSFFGNRRLELLAHLFQVHPKGLVRRLSRDNALGLELIEELSSATVSYAVGCALGRWDARSCIDGLVDRSSQDPFDPLPLCPPGMLVGPDGLPARPRGIVSEEWLRARPNAITLPPEGSVSQATIPDSEYPLDIVWDGILVDDPDHQDDIVRRVREVLELLWKDRAPAIEQEACEILGVKDLRDYFRNPKHFWDEHVKRYSKSRRKAPIYWLLQSEGRRYALWLYYHRLDRDMLYKALRNYVDPKHRREESRLRELREPLTSMPQGRELKALEREVEEQETLVNEVLDFKERLEKVAALGLDPDLNDGVILNIAPLHELVPWKEPKKCWDELLAGKYEWSAIGKQLREKGLIRG